MKPFDEYQTLLDQTLEIRENMVTFSELCIGERQKHWTEVSSDRLCSINGRMISES
jgi:hypothetical protein